MNFIVLLDHLNAELNNLGALEIFRPWVLAISKPEVPTVLSVHVRSYGGWFSGVNTTTERQTISAQVQERWPSVLKVDHVFIRNNFQFADQLLSDKTQDITHTTSTRQKPIRFSTTDKATACPNSQCEVKKIKKWMKDANGCTLSGCALSYFDCFVRSEQKQVDIHLATDLLSLAFQSEEDTEVLIVSDDVDMTPAILVAASASKSSTSISVFRSNQKPLYADSKLSSLGVRLLSKEN
jgi:uncharacterized LabA/DUF88 family protein